jgi:hypothetical protein
MELRDAAAAVVDFYESGGSAVADFQAKLAAAVGVEPFASITAACADLTYDLTSAQASLARSFLGA